jgi:hypothetical protein
MQFVSHKNQALSTCERFFIERSLELLYIGSIDSYRVKLNNPFTVLEELKYTLEEFQKGRIKHFLTIKAKEKDGKSLVDEALTLIKKEPSCLQFSSVSKEYLVKIIGELSEYNYKRLLYVIGLLLRENGNYIVGLFDILADRIAANVTSLQGLDRIDTLLNFLLSGLIAKGFSKAFLYKLSYGVFVNSLTAGRNFTDHFNSYRQRLLLAYSNHTVIFRIDTTRSVYDSISAIPHHIITISDDVNDVQLTGVRKEIEYASFNTRAADRKFIRCNIMAADYLAALKYARSTLSEYLDIINLGLTDEFLHIHNRALVLDQRSPENGDFQNNVNIIDGKYRVAQDYYAEFAQKLPIILGSANVTSDTKEKIKSAIRYLRLGNQSTEVEHKFINYWIGLEYMFSNYESNSTINRVKEHFINAHSLAYVRRNVYNLLKSFRQLSAADKALVPAYNDTHDNFLREGDFYEQVSLHLLNSFPLLAHRAMKLRDLFFRPNSTPNAKDYLASHRENLEIHLTRIYRLRNEIVHDASTNAGNEQIAANLRYYLTFILNEIIDFASGPTSADISIEDYFILNEVKWGNLQNSGCKLTDLLDTGTSIRFLA